MLLRMVSAMAAVMAVLGDDASNLMTGKRHDVYIAGFFPYDKSVPESHIGRGVMPAVKLAVDHINENPSVLRNHLLHMWWNDTQVCCIQKTFFLFGRLFCDKWGGPGVGQ